MVFDHFIKGALNLSDIKLRVVNLERPERKWGAYKNIGIAKVNDTEMNRLRAKPGYFIEIVGENSTVAIVLRSRSAEEGTIQLDDFARKNAGVDVGEPIQVYVGKVYRERGGMLTLTKNWLVYQPNSLIPKFVIVKFEDITGITKVGRNEVRIHLKNGDVKSLLVWDQDEFINELTQRGFTMATPPGEGISRSIMPAGEIIGGLALIIMVISGALPWVLIKLPIVSVSASLFDYSYTINSSLGNLIKVISGQNIGIKDFMSAILLVFIIMCILGFVSIIMHSSDGMEFVGFFGLISSIAIIIILYSFVWRISWGGSTFSVKISSAGIGAYLFLISNVMLMIAGYVNKQMKAKFIALRKTEA